jgi:hypothetical protein
MAARAPCCGTLFRTDSMRPAVLLVFLTACASAGNSSEEPAGHQAAIFSSPQTATILADAPRAASISIARPPAAVWLAAKKTYADLDIPLAVENPATHQMGNADFYKSRQFGGQPMAQFVDCGSGMTGPKASTYRIYMSLLTMIMTDGSGGTTVRTTFVPMGQDMTGGSSDRIVCGTTGRLELMVLDRIKTNAGG